MTANGRNMIAKDAVLLDAFVADCLGYHWREIEHVSMAADLGVGLPYRNRDQIIELYRRTIRYRLPAQSGWYVKFLSAD